MLNYREAVAAGYGTLRPYGVSTATAEPTAPPTPPAVPAAALRSPSPAEAAASAAAAAASMAASNAGFDVNGNGKAAAAAGDKGNDEARTIVLERCAALVRTYGLRKQAIAVDSLLEQMEQSGVQINARFLNYTLVRGRERKGHVVWVRERGGRKEVMQLSFKVQSFTRISKIDY